MKHSLRLTAAMLLCSVIVRGQQPALPSTPLAYGDITATFAADGTFTIGGAWGKFSGSWNAESGEAEFVFVKPPKGCEQPGKYLYRIDGKQVRFAIVADACMTRRMIFTDSVWLPVGEKPVIPERRVVRTSSSSRPWPERTPATGSWPSFRGPQASGIADGQNLPDTWDVKTGQNILWRTPIAGLAHSSPVVWGDTVYVTTAISSQGSATFKPGLYGDGDASEDRSRHAWKLAAIDKKTGAVRWDQVVTEGPPVDKRHIKSTYASATPVTDGRVVVASFGSMGVFAYDVTGGFRWKVDYGKIHLGAYDLPSWEWGPASSPIIWNDLVILQVDTHADSFLLALKADTGVTVWKTAREEIPSWGTPTVAMTPAGPVLVTNASNFVRGYDPRTGKELWRIGKSSKITAPTPIFADGLWVIASGRAPERPIFVVKPDAAGDLTLADGETSNAGVAWAKNQRGPYMPTPLAYKGVLYVLANNGLFDAIDLQTGKDIYRQRLPDVGSGFSASPVAADGKIYLSSEDGGILVIAAGPEFSHIATNSMDDLLMATPALSDGVMYVRTTSSVIAIGKK
jgi:hypothetical protein